MTDTPAPDRLIRTAEVLRLTSLSRSSLHRLMKSGDFPRGRKISANRRGWRLSEVQRWIEEDGDA